MKIKKKIFIILVLKTNGLKFYMDLKFISSTKLLILYGIIGFVFSTIACIIETSFECVGSEKEFFCNVYNSTIIFEEINNETIITNEINIRYIENFLIFIEESSKEVSPETTILLLEM